MNVKEILFEKENYFIVKSNQHKGYDVYKSGITHATRCAQIGLEGQAGLDRAKAEIERRITK